MEVKMPTRTLNAEELKKLGCKLDSLWDEVENLQFQRHKLMDECLKQSEYENQIIYIRRMISIEDQMVRLLKDIRDLIWTE